jgi:uncharacterized protein (TIGR03435 family)
MESGSMKMLRATVCADVVVLMSISVFGQSPATLPSFEAASIKPNKSGDRKVSIRRSPGRFTTSNTTLKMLITFAYDIRGHQLSGGPGWLDSDRYDIVAKADGANPSEAELKQMVQMMLADRFQLTIHRETKEMPVYALVVGKNGPKLHEAEGTGPQMSMGRGQLTAKKVSMELFAKQLGNQLGRSVVDNTSLNGDFDFKLEWTPDSGQPMGPKEGGVDGPAPADASGPTIFTAVQEQLGLKLEAQKGPVEILVIDRAEKASEN